MSTITDKIIRRIHAKKRGWVFTPKDFLDIGSRAAVDQVLSRLANKQGKIRRLDRGLYDYPKQHPLLGTLAADTDSIAQALARQSGDVVFPSGAVAANMFGLSTQVPAKPVYMTNSASRTKNVAGRTITFKHARVPLMRRLPDKINYLLQALAYLGKNSIDSDVIQRCVSRLDDKDINTLSDAASQVPGWMADILRKIQDAYNGNLRQAA